MRVALVALVVVLVALSGCSGLFATGHEYPSGVTADGVDNATAVADAHQEELRDGYRVEEVTTYRAANGTVLQRVESETRWSPSEHASVRRYENDHPAFGVESRIYSNESGTWLRVERPSGEVTVETGSSNDWRSPVAGPAGEWETVYVMAGAPDTSTTTFQNGTTRIHFEGARHGEGNSSGTMDVTADGLVTRYEVSYDELWPADGPVDNEMVRVHTVRNYSRIGAPSISEPDWLSNATAPSASS